MLREIGTYKDPDEKVEAELAKLELMEENGDISLGRMGRNSGGIKNIRHGFIKRAATAALFMIEKRKRPSPMGRSGRRLNSIEIRRNHELSEEKL